MNKKNGVFRRNEELLIRNVSVIFHVKQSDQSCSMKFKKGMSTDIEKIEVSSHHQVLERLKEQAYFRKFAPWRSMSFMKVS